MLCTDPGVLSGSEVFYFTASKTAEALLYYYVQCGHYHCDVGYQIRRAAFPYLLLCYVRQGAFTIEYEQRTYIVPAGQAALIDCRKAHNYYATGYMEFLWAHIDGLNCHELTAHINAVQGVCFGGEAAELVARKLYALVSACRNRQALSEPAASEQIHGALCALLPQTSAAGFEKEDETPVGKALAYMRAHLTKDLSLNEIAAAAGLSPYYFSRLFKAETGSTPYEYVLARRIDRARHLLKTTDMSVKEIAFAIGYKSEARFIGAFTDRIGLPPGKYRKFPI